LAVAEIDEFEAEEPVVDDQKGEFEEANEEEGDQKLMVDPFKG